MLLAIIREQLSFLNSVTSPQKDIKAVLDVYASAEPQNQATKYWPILNKIFQWIYSIVMTVLREL